MDGQRKRHRLTKRRNRIIVIVVMVLIAGLWARRKYVDRNYVYVMAKHVAWYAAPEGSTSTFEVYYGNRVHTVKTSGDDRMQDGHYYFVEILPDHSCAIIDILHEVPECVLNAPLPQNGWKSIPVCPDK